MSQPQPVIYDLSPRRRAITFEDTLDFRSRLPQASSISSLAIFGKVADGFYWEAK